MRMSVGLCLLLAGAFLVPGCDGGFPEASTAEEEPVDIQTGAEVCALIDPAQAATVLGWPSVDARASSEGTPQCSYESPAVNESPVVVSVLRTFEDLADRKGGNAFQYYLEINRGLYPGITTSEVMELGGSAVFMESPDVKLLVAQVGARLLTVRGPGLSADTASAMAAAAIASMTAGATEAQ